MCREEVATFDLAIHRLGHEFGRRGFGSRTSGLPQSNRRRYLDQCHCTRTDLLQSRKLSVETGRSIWLKLGALQPIGSFKVRGSARRAKNIC